MVGLRGVRVGEEQAGGLLLCNISMVNEGQYFSMLCCGIMVSSMPALQTRRLKKLPDFLQVSVHYTLKTEHMFYAVYLYILSAPSPVNRFIRHVTLDNPLHVFLHLAGKAVVPVPMPPVLLLLS